MVDVFRTWESLYWAIPKGLGHFVKTQDGDFGWGSDVEDLTQLFLKSNNLIGAQLYERIKNLSKFIIKNLI